MEEDIKKYVCHDCENHCTLSCVDEPERCPIFSCTAGWHEKELNKNGHDR